LGQQHSKANANSNVAGMCVHIIYVLYLFAILFTGLLY